MLTINDLFEKKRTNIEESFDEFEKGNGFWNLSQDISDERLQEYFPQDESDTEFEKIEITEDEWVKEFFVDSVFYFQFLLERLESENKLMPKKSSSPVDYTNGTVSADILGMFPYFLEKTMDDMWDKDSQQKYYKKKIDVYAQNVKLEEDSVKQFVNKAFTEKLFSVDEALSYAQFTAENKNYISSAYLLSVKKSYKNFLETGKCSEQTFPLVLALFTDFLNEKYLLNGEHAFSHRVITFLYYVAFTQNKQNILNLFSDIVMNKIYMTRKLESALMRHINEEEKKERMKRILENNPTHFCFSIVNENEFLKILQYGTELEKDAYEQLFKLYKFVFNLNLTEFEEDEKKYHLADFLKKIWQEYESQLAEFPGIILCISELMKFLDKKTIEDFFAKKDISALRQEWGKVSKVKNTLHEQLTQMDIETFSFIWNAETQKELEKTYSQRVLLLDGIFYAQIYGIFKYALGDLFQGNWNEKWYALYDDFHDFFIHKDFQDSKKKKAILKKISEFLFEGTDFFSDFDIDFETQSGERCAVVYFLSRFETDKLHAVIDFLNHVREKQKIVLPVVPNTYLTYTLEEAKAEKEKLIANQNILREKIDVGFKIYWWQTVSTIRLQDSMTIFRKLCIKSFVETDKKYTISYYQKNKSSEYYKFAKKEDFRVTNKNHLENHYLYSDRNVFTHNAANYMVIESLLDDDKSENLIYALYDIKKFLNRMENERRAAKSELEKEKKKESDEIKRGLLGHIDLTGIVYLQNEFSELTKKIWKVLISRHYTDPWKEIFCKDEIRAEYKERIANLDYNHDFGPHFLEILNDFLVKIYNAYAEFFFICDVQIFFYLIFQNFALERIKL